MIPGSKKGIEEICELSTQQKLQPNSNEADAMNKLKQLIALYDRKVDIFRKLSSSRDKDIQQLADIVDKSEEPLTMEDYTNAWNMLVEFDKKRRGKNHGDYKLHDVILTLASRVINNPKTPIPLDIKWDPKSAAALEALVPQALAALLSCGTSLAIAPLTYPLTMTSKVKEKTAEQVESVLRNKTGRNTVPITILSEKSPTKNGNGRVLSKFGLLPNNIVQGIVKMAMPHGRPASESDSASTKNTI